MKRQTDKPFAGPSRRLSASSIESAVISEGAIKRREKQDKAREDAYCKNFDNQLEVRDPFEGTIGRSVKLTVNCFELWAKTRTINRYEVLTKIHSKKGVQIPTKKHLKRELFWDFVLRTGLNTFKVHPTQLCFDDERMLVTTKPLSHLDEKRTWRIGEHITFPHDYEGPRGKFGVTIEMVYIEQFEMGGNLETTPMAQYVIQNVITQARRIPETWEGGDIYNCMGKFAIRIGMNETYKPIEIDLISRLYEGLCINVKTGIRGKPILNLALAHKLLIQMELPLIQFYALCEAGRIYSDARLDELARRRISLDRNQVGKFNHYFKRVEIKTNYKPIRHYTFQELSDSNAKNTRFEDAEGASQTVKEYYRRKYNIPLRFPYLPLIQTTKPGIYIPIEVCMVSLRPQRVHMKISSETSRQICLAATKDPRSYFDKVNTMAGDIVLGENPKNVMREFGVEVPFERNRLKPMSIQGRILPTPICRYEDREWVGRPDGNVEESAYHSYLVACTINMRRFTDANVFLAELINAARELDQRFVNDRDVRFSDKEFDSYEQLKNYVDRKIDEYKSQAKKNKSDMDRMLFVFILGENSDQLYSWIKRCGDIELGICTQCIDGSELIKKTRSNKLRPMCKNLVLKTTTRLEGTVNVIETTRNNPCNAAFSKYTTKDDPTLFIGVFSTKAQSEEKRDTILTMSFNSNADASNFQGRYCFAEDGTDFIDETREMFSNVLSDFVKKLNRMPSRVLIFRTGITDNLVEAVSDFEVENFHKSWNLYFERHPNVRKFNPQLLYINVSRKHGVRFLREESSSRGRPDYNIQKGTVVDNSPINSPLGNGFYLCSHKGLLGTSKSAYYEIQYNSWDVDLNRFPDELQPIIFSLCYLLQRSINTISIPAPAYYSQLLSDRVLQYLKTETNPQRLNPHRNIALTTYFT